MRKKSTRVELVEKRIWASVGKKKREREGEEGAV